MININDYLLTIIQSAIKGYKDMGPGETFVLYIVMINEKYKQGRCTKFLVL